MSPVKPDLKTPGTRKMCLKIGAIIGKISVNAKVFRFGVFREGQERVRQLPRPRGGIAHNRTRLPHVRRVGRALPRRRDGSFHTSPEDRPERRRRGRRQCARAVFAVQHHPQLDSRVDRLHVRRAAVHPALRLRHIPDGDLHRHSPDGFDTFLRPCEGHRAPQGGPRPIQPLRRHRLRVRDVPLPQVERDDRRHGLHRDLPFRKEGQGDVEPHPRPQRLHTPLRRRARSIRSPTSS